MWFRRQHQEPSFPDGTGRMGTMVIGGIAWPVTGLRLVCGGLEIEGTLTGPVPAMEAEPVTLFGADGRGVLQGGAVSVPGAGPGEPSVVRVPLRVERVR